MKEIQPEKSNIGPAIGVLLVLLLIVLAWGLWEAATIRDLEEQTANALRDYNSAVSDGHAAWQELLDYKEKHHCR